MDAIYRPSSVSTKNPIDTTVAYLQSFSEISGDRIWISPDISDDIHKGITTEYNKLPSQSSQISHNCNGHKSSPFINNHSDTSSQITSHTSPSSDLSVPSLGDEENLSPIEDDSKNNISSTRPTNRPSIATFVDDPIYSSDFYANDELRNDTIFCYCAACGVGLGSASIAIRHVRSTHMSADVQLKCPYCPYASPRTHHLKRHLLQHSSYRPFSCPYCTYTARRKDHLSRHINTHASKENKKANHQINGKTISYENQKTNKIFNDFLFASNASFRPSHVDSIYRVPITDCSSRKAATSDPSKSSVNSIFNHNFTDNNSHVLSIPSYNSQHDISNGSTCYASNGVSSFVSNLKRSPSPQKITSNKCQKLNYPLASLSTSSNPHIYSTMNDPRVNSLLYSSDSSGYVCRAATVNTTSSHSGRCTRTQPLRGPDGRFRSSMPTIVSKHISAGTSSDLDNCSDFFCGICRFSSSSWPVLRSHSYGHYLEEVIDRNAWIAKLSRTNGIRFPRWTTCLCFRCTSSTFATSPYTNSHANISRVSRRVASKNSRYDHSHVVPKRTRSPSLSYSNSQQQKLLELESKRREKEMSDQHVPPPRHRVAVIKNRDDNSAASVVPPHKTSPLTSSQLQNSSIDITSVTHAENSEVSARTHLTRSNIEHQKEKSCGECEYDVDSSDHPASVSYITCSTGTFDSGRVIDVSDVTFECPKCNFTTKSLGDLNDHITESGHVPIDNSDAIQMSPVCSL